MANLTLLATEELVAACEVNDAPDCHRHWSPRLSWFPKPRDQPRSTDSASPPSKFKE